MTEQQITYLIVRQFQEDLNTEEARILDEWAAQSPANQLLLEDFADPELLGRFLQASHETNAANSISRIRERVKQSIHGDDRSKIVHRIHFLRSAWFRYAAAIILFIGIGAYLWNTQQKEKPQIVHTNPTPVKNDIMPGKDRAILTLSSGQQVELNDAASETIKDGTLSIENNNGQLVYKKGGLVAMNTMTTPKGGQYKLTLSDGTKVWLNAASSITYPTAFGNNSREVSITGEAYFEVSPNPKQPFVVKTHKDRIAVLGTSFNVNAYPDEPALATTLIEGVVKVSGVILKPGEQAQLSYAGNGLQVKRPDLEEVLAWKQGKFQFTNEPITTIMRQLSRWYDVDIMYNGKVSEAVFSGTLLRSQNPFSLINAMEKTGEIHFQVKGKTIVVLNGPKPE